MTVRLPRFWASSTYGPHSTPRRVLLYLTSSVLATNLIPYRHSLLVNAIAWQLVWCYCVYRCGLRQPGHKDGKRKAARAAGLLFAVSAICERVAGDEMAVLALRALLPCFTFTASYVASEMHSDGVSSYTSSNLDEEPRAPWQPTGSRYFVSLSLTAAISWTVGTYISQQAIVLGLTAVFAQALALVLLTTTGSSLGHDRRRKPSESGIDVRPIEIHYEQDTTTGPGYLTIVKPLASAAAAVCWVGSISLEQLPSIDGMSLSTSTTETVPLLLNIAPFTKGAFAPMFAALNAAFLIFLTLDFGSMRASVVSLSSAIFAQTWSNPSTSSIGQAILYGLEGTLYWRAVDGTTTGNVKSATRSQSILLSYVILVLAASWLMISSLSVWKNSITVGGFRWPSETKDVRPPSDGRRPADLTSHDRHPIDMLSSAAADRFNETISRQSQTLNDAVTEYGRRYRVHPPPNFDRWFEYAKRKGTVLIDEFDSIHHDLLPFWAFSPYTLRQRVQQAFGYDVNGLMTLMIRKGEITLMDGSREWLREALREMTADFIEYLPDMDIAFNIHDEPRVTVPHSELSQMVHYVKSVAHPSVLANQAPRNLFSTKPTDMTDGKDYKRTTITRFNKFSHQPTWSHARLSCSPESPARDYLERAPDNLTAYAVGDVGFIYNYTAFTDICNSPSLSSTYGFFDRPNMFIPTQDLVPVFSQSKLSSFQDIVYPSPWYWANKVKYDEKEDVTWDQKDAKLYWRGSTTGGYSRYGGWRRHHRQRAVQHVNALDKTRILRNYNADGEGAADWRSEKVQKTDYAASFDVHFSDIGQCDEGDCHAQKEFFKVAKKEEQSAAWKYRFLLDMDGNAFSGRFIAFLKSNSLVYKVALFKEWHSNWLQPWVHYIPLSLRGDEWFAAVRYFAGEREGKRLAKEMAQQSRDWANKALRKEDMQVWLFRLLLEYGRLLDDDRDNIGYAGP